VASEQQSMARRISRRLNKVFESGTHGYQKRLIVAVPAGFDGQLVLPNGQPLDDHNGHVAFVSRGAEWMVDVPGGPNLKLRDLPLACLQGLLALHAACDNDLSQVGAQVTMLNGRTRCTVLARAFNYVLVQTEKGGKFTTGVNELEWVNPLVLIAEMFK
jgi:hypothetical protein